MDPTTIGIVVALVILAAMAAAMLALLAALAYVFLNPPTYIKVFYASKTHLCKHDTCRIDVRYEIGNIYPGTQVTLQVKKDGVLVDYLVDGLNQPNFDKHYRGDEDEAPSLFRGPGVYDLDLSLGGYLGIVARTRPGPTVLHRRITLLDEGQQRVPLTFDGGGFQVMVPAADRTSTTQEASIVETIDDKTEAPLPVAFSCKYMQVNALSLRMVDYSELGDADINRVETINAHPDAGGFLAPNDDPRSEHPSATVDVTIEHPDGSTTILGTFGPGPLTTLVLPSPIVAQPFKVISAWKSSDVPLYPTRTVTWTIDLHVECLSA